MRRLRIHTLGKGQQIHAVQNFVFGGRCLRCGQGGCENVQVADGLRVLRSFGQALGPFHEKWHADAAFIKSGFPAAKGFVQIRHPDVVRAAVVAGENNQGVVIQALVFEVLQHAADVAVQRADHGRVDAGGMVCNVRQGVVVLARGLQRVVRRVVGQVHEKGVLLVRVDGFDRLVGQVVGHVARRLKRLARIEANAPGVCGPQEFVDHVERLFGVDHLGRVFGQKHGGTMHQRQRLVKTMRISPELGAVTQMPFAQLQGSVA